MDFSQLDSRYSTKKILQIGMYLGLTLLSFEDTLCDVTQSTPSSSSKLPGAWSRHFSLTFVM